MDNHTAIIAISQWIMKPFDTFVLIKSECPLLGSRLKKRKSVGILGKIGFLKTDNFSVPIPNTMDKGNVTRDSVVVDTPEGEVTVVSRLSIRQRRAAGTMKLKDKPKGHEMGQQMTCKLSAAGDDQGGTTESWF